MIGFSNLQNTICINPFLLARRMGAVAQGSGGAVPSAPELSALIKGMADTSVRGPSGLVITCLITDSRRAVPGALFFAIKGSHTSGMHYVVEAVSRGAVAVVSEYPQPSGVSQVTWVRVPHVRKALAEISRRFYRHPENDLKVYGVTGTNGKTTVATLLQYLLRQSGTPTGLLGTVQYDLGRRTLPAYRTTPESVELYAMFDQMREASCKAAVMEISSHAIAQHRVHGLPVEVAAFTNLTQDHLDYHHTIEEYFETKAGLFTGKVGSVPAHAVINADDPYGRILAERLPATTQSTFFGVSPTAQVRAENISLKACGSAFDLVWPEGRASVRTALPGRDNVSNILAAMAMARAGGADIAKLAPLLADFSGVPGRMERVDRGQPFNVFVDYAHTDDALSNALGMLRDITQGRVLVVFGCGGNRDRAKRPLMVAAVQKWADMAWATADNPRKEPLADIFADMKEGVLFPERVRWLDDRREAIAAALENACPGDTVLIAGKGHETYQEFADTIIPFDDRQVAGELLSLRALRPNT